MCYKCYGRKFKEDINYFLKDTDHGHANITSEFMNIRKRLYGRNESTTYRLVAHIFEKTVEWEPINGGGIAGCLQYADDCCRGHWPVAVARVMHSAGIASGATN